MDQFNSKIKRFMKKTLDNNIPSVRFNTIWDRHQKTNNKLLGIRKAIAVPAAALCSLIALMIVGFTLTANVDKTDYAFVNDPSVIGKWQAVDFVHRVDQFAPDKRFYKDDLFLKTLVFIKNGSMLTATNNGNGNLGPTVFTWTQGIVISKQDKTAGKYEIKEIDGSTYMFFEWKDGGYVYFHMKPSYYILKKVDNQDYSSYKLTAREDKVDYPFVNDPQLIGKWQAVDFVETVDKFNPGIKRERTELELYRLDIAENGKMSIITSNNKVYAGSTWTKGLMLDKKDKIASKYEIKELKGETYLFNEFKNGDYIYRGTEPEYYVFKKIK